MQSDHAPFDLCNFVTVAVRQVVPFARAKGIAFAFDCRGGEPVVRADRTAMECALHRVLCAAVDVLDAGLVVFDVQVDARDGGWHALRLNAGGAGALAADAAIDAVLARLQMSALEVFDAVEPGARRAVGRCPRTGALVVFASLPAEGVMWRFELELPGADPAPAAAPPDAHQARAWVIDAEAAGAHSLARRLQRLGWATTIFASSDDALEQLRTMVPALARPALVIGAESDAVAPAGLAALVPMLPAGARCVLGVVGGSATLASDDVLPELDVALLPLGPAELRRWTERLAGTADAPSGLTQPAPLLMGDRPRLLVVDDNDVNRVVASALTESLGYDASVARDGLEAIDACRAAPPAVVLMDLTMPRLDGIEATRRLRALQRRGVIPPFRIVAATADVSADAQQRCTDAGMDGFLVKPLRLDAIRKELRRLSVERGAV